MLVMVVLICQLVFSFSWYWLFLQLARTVWFVELYYLAVHEREEEKVLDDQTNLHEDMNT